jgi:hypothetical protein
MNTFVTIAPSIVGTSSIAPKMAAEGTSSAIPEAISMLPRVAQCRLSASCSPTSRSISSLASHRFLREPAKAGKAFVVCTLAVRID